jgi:peptidyl-prolyl cis-trans isomerase D
MLRWKDKVLAGMDGQKLFRNSGAYLLLGLSVIAMTFFGICTPESDMMMLPSGSAAKVAGEKITAAEFQRAYRNMSERLQAQYQEGFESLRGEIPKYVMRQLVDERVMYQAAVRAGVQAQEDDVVRMLREAKAFQDEQGKFSTESFENYLRRQGYTEATFTEEIRRSLTVQQFRQFVSGLVYVSEKASALDYRISEGKMEADFLKLEPSMAKVTVSPEDLKKFLDDAGKAKVKGYYESHTSDYNTKERVKARHILVSYKGSRNASGAGALRTKAEAKSRAEDILGQVKAPGADFAKIATKMTDEESGKSRGGDLGFFDREAMVKEFSEAAFALNAGQISQIVESPFGFHVIKVEEKKTAKQTTLEQATDEIARKLIEQERAPTILQQKADAILADLKAGKSVDESVKSLGAKWESTGQVAAGAMSLPKVDGDQSMVDALAQLSKAGSVVDRVFDVRGSKVILKLKSRQEVDESKLDEKKKKELAEMAASSAGYALMSAYEKSLRKELEQKGKIWENPEYLSLGQSRGEGADQGAGG